MKSPQAMTREELEEEVIVLRGLMAFDTDDDRVAHWRGHGLTASAARVMFALHHASPRWLSKSYLLDIASKGNIDRYSSDKIAHVYIHHIKKVLGKTAIKNVWAQGYMMTAEGAGALKSRDLPSQRGLKVTALQRVGRGGRSG